MADDKQINLRLPVTLYEQLSIASETTGVSKNRIFNDAVTAATNGYDGTYEKPKYVHTCVRLPGKRRDAVRSMANQKYGTINTMLVQMLADYLGVEPCVAIKEGE